MTRITLAEAHPRATAGDATEREMALVRLALLGGPLGEQFGRDYAGLPEHAREQIDGSIEGIIAAVDRTHPRAATEVRGDDGTQRQMRALRAEVGLLREVAVAAEAALGWIVGPTLGPAYVRQTLRAALARVPR